MSNNPLLTPLPAALSAAVLRSTGAQADAMAGEQAAQLTGLAVVPPLTPPTLSEAVLCEHRSTLSLFSQCFAAAAAVEGPSPAGAAGVASPGAHLFMLHVSAGALALDLHLHCKAEARVVHDALERSCGREGAMAAAQGRRECEEMGAEVDALLQALMEARQLGSGTQGGAKLGDAGSEAAQVGQGGSNVGRDGEAGAGALVARLRRLEALFEAHQAEAECRMLPRLATALPVSEQRALAASFYEAQRNAALLLPGVEAAGAPAAGEPARPGGGAGEAATGEPEPADSSGDPAREMRLGEQA